MHFALTDQIRTMIRFSS